MFDIEYKGASSIVINTKSSSVVFDPKTSLVGLKDVTVKDKIEVVTDSRFKVDGGQRVVFEYPGDYEIGDFSIKGIAVRRHIDAPSEPMSATMYRVEVADIKIAVLGNIEATLSDEQLEELGVIDMVVVPVGGGGYTLNATEATQLVRQIDARVIIPVHYADAQLQYEVVQDDLEVFVKEMDISVETVPGKYKLKSVSALPETNTVVVIERS